jgi:carbon monoxide dehydrogenase subunit G
VRLENSFQVQARPEQAWELLLDVPRVIPCMPGAELTDVVDERTYKATMQVKLGPISLKFATDVELEESDEAARRVRMTANARELRGRGGGRATIESSLAAIDGGTQVDIVTDMALTGAVAQYGRGIVQDVSSQLVRRFAECLEAQLVASPADAEPAVARPVEPVAGLSLGLGAVARAAGRFVRRLLRRG